MELEKIKLIAFFKNQKKKGNKLSGWVPCSYLEPKITTYSALPSFVLAIIQKNVLTDRANIDLCKDLLKNRYREQSQLETYALSKNEYMHMRILLTNVLSS